MMSCGADIDIGVAGEDLGFLYTCSIFDGIDWNTVTKAVSNNQEITQAVFRYPMSTVRGARSANMWDEDNI